MKQFISFFLTGVILFIGLPTSAQTIVGMAMNSDNYTFTWYSNGMYSVGEPDDLDLKTGLYIQLDTLPPLQVDSLARLAQLDSLTRLVELDSLTRLMELDSLTRLMELDSLTRLMELDSLTRLMELDSLARLMELDSLTRLMELDSLARLVELDSLTRLAQVDSLARLHCSDGIQNKDEMGVDCGGADCPDCEDSFTDPRDNQIYQTVWINGKRWMAQNLNYEMQDSWCYDNDPKNGEKYGRLYTWEAAKKACSPGWRLATDQEWRNMVKQYGGADDDAADGGKAAYKALIDEGSSGFDALLGGYRLPSASGSFLDLGGHGYYWSGTEKDTQGAWLYYFYSGYGELGRHHYDKSYGLSCRCIQGAPSNGID